ncbi:hypothetical protein K461DRAFT_291091 [Myriangium duriaei CBS 260.36]|uniref:Uncharacterized protein n=1 Tax=Myriangium duriaei CBS 260.36 TaxID=1168546 RepID=A0A9P4J682_9PEZI|nr:hypothetical protein K461DRAFT_291091 [Myriangium duriaei CBS 260.36]
MSPTRPVSRWRQVLVWLTFLLTLGSSIALIALLIDLTCISDAIADWRPMILASAALDIVSILVLMVFGTFLILQLHGQPRLPHSGKWILLTACVVLSLTAMILSLVSLSLVYKNIPHTSAKDVSHVQTLAMAGIAVCCIGILSQGAFLGFAFRQPTTINDNRHSVDNEGSFTAPSELKDSPSTINKSTYSKDEPPSPWPLQSSFPTTPPKRARVRESVQSLLQPKNSMQRLIRHASFQSTTTGTTERRDSWGHRPDEGFDSWTVDHDDPYVERHAQYTSTKLQPIPASRPGSPAKPLDGPFPAYDVPDSPTSPNPISPRTDSVTGSLRKPSIPASGRRPSLGVRARTSEDEQHVHPLFRTDSPGPPPVASPGTTVFISPWANQPPPFSHDAWRPGSRHSSRPGSPGTFSVRPGSAQSSASNRPHLRSVRSEESVASGPVRANMPPRPHPGILYAGEPV